MSDSFYNLEFFKSRKVETPAKHGAAAGWDFYVPTNLTIFDFMKNTEMYINEYVENIKFTEANGSSYLVPLDFEIKINNSLQLFNIIIYKANINDTKYSFKVVKLQPTKFLTSFIKINTNISLSNTQLTALHESYVNRIIVKAGSKVLIPSGIHVKLPANVFLNAENKSGIASKRGFVRGACTIDSDYQGEIHINLINPTKNDISILAGEKIIQFIPLFQPNMTKTVEYKSLDALYANTTSVRGTGGFGSSGTK